MSMWISELKKSEIIEETQKKQEKLKIQTAGEVFREKVISESETHGG